MASSMTGFGAAETEVSGRRGRVEIRTVNHRHFNASVRLPADLVAFEQAFRERLKVSIDRGHVSAVASWAESGADARFRIDWEAAEAAVATLQELRDRFQLAGEVTIEQVARFPDVMGQRRAQVDTSWEDWLPAIDAAIEACLADRQREGAALVAEIVTRIDSVDAALRSLEPLLPERLERELERLKANIRELLAGADVAPERLAQEIALFADRVDVTEEVVRLRAHLRAAHQLLAGDGPVGKQLGFLAQEIGREVNTIGSKAGDAAIAHIVVAMKGDLEKVREQLENLE